MKVLGIIDSFKGSITSKELGEILKEELSKKKILCDYIPLSDGGEGFLEMLESFDKKLKRIYVETFDPLLRKINTYYLVDEEKKKAYLEYAKSSGVGLLQVSEYNPYQTSSYGFGIIIKDALNRGYYDLTIGIGGSITNDGGSGIIEALGGRFYDKSGNLLTYINNEKLNLIENIEINLYKNINIRIVSDVKNLILGSSGSTYVFAIQKGAKQEDLPYLEKNMENYVQKVEETLQMRFRDIEGSGAAGGVGFALLALFNAQVIKGINYFFEKINFEEIISKYDYIITGEGKIDQTSLYGKVVFAILKRVPKGKVIVICGDNELANEYFSEYQTKVYKIVGNLTTLENSLKEPKKYLKKLIKLITFPKN